MATRPTPKVKTEPKTERSLEDIKVEAICKLDEVKALLLELKELRPQTAQGIINLLEAIPTKINGIK